MVGDITTNRIDYERAQWVWKTISEVRKPISQWSRKSSKSLKQSWVNTIWTYFGARGKVLGNSGT